MTDPRRALIVTIAQSQTVLGVSSSEGEAQDTNGRTPRKGWVRLLEYFHIAAPGQWADDAIKYTGPIPDWCGIFALWAIKSAGIPVGTWWKGFGIASVTGFTTTNSPQSGDIGYKEFIGGNRVQHMNLVAQVAADGSISTIDGNDSGRITGPSHPKPRREFDAFYTAFNPATAPGIPVGRWEVQVGVWTWNYVFYPDQTCDWRDIVHPNVVLGKGTWRIDSLLRIIWPTGAQEEWDLPLNPEMQTGTLIGQGKIIKAKRISQRVI